MNYLCWICSQFYLPVIEKCNIGCSRYHENENITKRKEKPLTPLTRTKEFIKLILIKSFM